MPLRSSALPVCWKAAFVAPAADVRVTAQLVTRNGRRLARLVATFGRKLGSGLFVIRKKLRSAVASACSRRRSRGSAGDVRAERRRRLNLAAYDLAEARRILLRPPRAAATSSAPSSGSGAGRAHRSPGYATRLGESARRHVFLPSLAGRPAIARPRLARAMPPFAQSSSIRSSQPHRRSSRNTTKKPATRG